MYKDKQREANRQAQARFKAKGITNRPLSGITEQGITQGVTPASDQPKKVYPLLKRGVTEQSGERGLISISPSAEGSTASIGHGVIPKRGKDKQRFIDLPPDVQQTIDRMGVVDGSIDMTGYEAWRAERGR